jgi:phosphoserine phosphatase RsbU/P
MRPERIDEKYLAQFPLFAGLDTGELHELAEVLRARELPPGELLYREGEPGDRMAFLLQGEVDVIKALGTADERVLGSRTSGEFLGEMSLLDPDGRRTASVRTLTSLYYVELSRADFPLLLRRCPGLAYDMLQMLSRRLQHAHDGTINDLRAKNRQLERAYEELRAAQAQLVEKEKLERELQVAREIQASMLPHELPQRACFQFGALMEAARAVGGDLFDFVALPGDRIGVMIGDVCDKGVPAALFMALTRSLVRAEIDHAPTPGDLLRRVNKLLLDMNDAGMFVTMLYGELNSSTGQFAYARAGHETPFLVGGDGRLLPSQPATGLPLGIFENPKVDEQTLMLPPGTTLILHTDGATDMANPAGEDFGHERLWASVQTSLSGNDLSAQEVCNGTWRALRDYQGSAPQADDVTLVVIRATC